MVKVCSKCKEEKPLEEFHKQKGGKYGVNSRCKSCRKAYQEANKEKIKKRGKAYYESNKDKIKAYYKAYREANKEKNKAYQKAYYKANKDKSKAYREANKDKINRKRRERINTDPLLRLKNRLRSRTTYAFKSKGYRKNTKTQEILGVNWEVAKEHIERQFKKGMSWDNHGEWNIDHIIPLVSANTEEQLMRLCHYTNLQPLWAEENFSKSAKILGQQTMLRI